MLLMVLKRVCLQEQFVSSYAFSCCQCQFQFSESFLDWKDKGEFLEYMKKDETVRCSNVAIKSSLQSFDQGSRQAGLLDCILHCVMLIAFVELD